MQVVNVGIYLGYSFPILPFETLLANQKVQVLTEVRKQMRFFDAELKDSKRRAEEMQQAPCFFCLTGMILWIIQSEQTNGWTRFIYMHKLLTSLNDSKPSNH